MEDLNKQIEYLNNISEEKESNKFNSELIKTLEIIASEIEENRQFMELLALVIRMRGREE